MSYSYDYNEAANWKDVWAPRALAISGLVGFLLFVFACFNVMGQQRTVTTFSGATVTTCNDPLWPPFKTGDYDCVNHPIKVKR